MHEELIGDLKNLAVETGSIACLGCGHEHRCSTHGCAILRDAVAALETLNAQLAAKDAETWTAVGVRADPPAAKLVLCEKGD